MKKKILKKKMKEIPKKTMKYDGVEKAEENDD